MMPSPVQLLAASVANGAGSHASRDLPGVGNGRVGPTVPVEVPRVASEHTARSAVVAGRSLAIAVAVVGALAGRAAAEDKVAADVAFRQAKALEREGKTAEACKLYEASYAADPQLGALLNVANCHETLGRTATAWAEFREAEELAMRKGDARSAFARRRVDALATRLVKLRVDAAALPGLLVKRDGNDITALLGSEIPLDPGVHELAASAPGRVAWSARIEVTGDGTVTRASVPELAVLPVAPPIREPARVVPPATPVPAPRAAAPAASSRRTWALATGGAGLVAVAVGAGFGLDARSAWTASRDPAKCDAGGVCSPEGAALTSRARSSASIATWTMGAGAALVATGAVLWLTAPPRRERRIAVLPAVDATSAGAAVVGRF